MKGSTKWRRLWRLRRFVWSDSHSETERRKTGRRRAPSLLSLGLCFTIKAAIVCLHSCRSFFCFSAGKAESNGRGRQTQWISLFPSVNQGVVNHHPPTPGRPPFLEATCSTPSAHFLRHHHRKTALLSARLLEDAHLWAEDAWRGHGFNLCRRCLRHVFLPMCKFV